MTCWAKAPKRRAQQNDIQPLAGDLCILMFSAGEGQDAQRFAATVLLLSKTRDSRDDTDIEDTPPLCGYAPQASHPAPAVYRPRRPERRNRRSDREAAGKARCLLSQQGTAKRSERQDAAGKHRMYAVCCRPTRKWPGRAMPWERSTRSCYLNPRDRRARSASVLIITVVFRAWQHHKQSDRMPLAA